jgi:hypothetical protein
MDVARMAWRGESKVDTLWGQFAAANVQGLHILYRKHPDLQILNVDCVGEVTTLLSPQEWVCRLFHSVHKT